MPTAPTQRTTLKRAPERGRHDRATVDAILDEAYLCHLGLVDPDGRPFVIPTIHARAGDVLYVHGSPASRALRTGSDTDCCVAVTILDGLVLARSAFKHSMNYRSVIVYGRATKVDDRDEKLAALDAVVEHVLAGRADTSRRPDEKELSGTLVLRLDLDEASAKVRTGGPLDHEADLGLDVWAGVVPLRIVAGDPLPEPGITAPWPGYSTNRSKAP